MSQVTGPEHLRTPLSQRVFRPSAWQSRSRGRHLEKPAVPASQHANRLKLRFAYTNQRADLEDKPHLRHRRGDSDPGVQMKAAQFAQLFRPYLHRSDSIRLVHIRDNRLAGGNPEIRPCQTGRDCRVAGPGPGGESHYNQELKGRFRPVASHGLPLPPPGERWPRARSAASRIARAGVRHAESLRANSSNWNKVANC